MINTIEYCGHCKWKSDTSSKPYEVQRAEYVFDKESRKLINIPQWHHFKYYNSEETANDAVRDFRNSRYDKRFKDDKEKITIARYRVSERKIWKEEKLYLSLQSNNY